MANYDVSTKTIEDIIGFIKSGQIAIPEIQRPFVWKPKQVRDLIDSLYSDYPTGYLIISQNPNMRLKDGSLSIGKQILIDGQQRVTALMTALAGVEIIGNSFEKKRIKIAFNPQANSNNDESFFEVQSNAILKDKKWVSDIADIFSPTFDSYEYVDNYCEINQIEHKEDRKSINKTIQKLRDILNRAIGVITLKSELSIEQVTEIFIRINSQGAKLNQADFAMSKIASNTTYNGNILRKAIDYFSHLATTPSWYNDMTKDTEFMTSEFAPRIKWLKDDIEDIFDPDYGDILRASFMYKFGRAKMKDLVSLLSGRDFETREHKEEIAENSFALLTEGTHDFMNQYNFSNFILAIKSAGFIKNKLINSKITLVFAYTLYLILNNDSSIDKTQLKRYVSKWYVMSTLTSRYISSSESTMDFDLKRIKEKGFLNFLKEVEEAELSDTFWTIGLVQNLETQVVNSPYFNIFIAAQIYFGNNSLFSNNIKIRDLASIIGDVHHIFPKQYLIKNGINDRTKYNQIANFTYLDTTINKSISDTAPNEYFSNALSNFRTTTEDSDSDFYKNLEQNCIPAKILNMTYLDYNDFISSRRKLMAEKIKQYYYSL